MARAGSLNGESERNVLEAAEGVKHVQVLEDG